MLSRLNTPLLGGVHIAVLVVVALLTVESWCWSLSGHGILAPTIRQPYPVTKINAQPAAASAAQIARGVQETVEQSKLRQTIETIKQSATSSMANQGKEERKDETTAWRVVLYNDDIHSFTYVTESLAEAIPQLSREVAHTITVEAHNSGQATVLRTWQKKAEAYCIELQKRGLTVCTIHDSCPK